MKEMNKKHLEEALRQLPTYRPTEGVWVSIYQELSTDPLPTAVKNLPTHTPPASVWNHINHALSSSNAEQPKLYAQAIKFIRWGTSIAAAILLFSVGYFVATLSQKTRVSYSIRQETAQLQNVKADWNDEEVSFERVMAQLREVKDPYLQSLLRDLVELSAAKHEVEKMLRDYGNDHHVIRQLADIETKRAQVYRQAINEL